MTRTLVVSDIHGCYDEFNALLEKVSYNPSDDVLILLGDYTDRGPKSKEVVEQIITLHRQWGAVVLRGNHDQMMVDAFAKKEDARWIKNGALHTIASYCDLDLKDGMLEQEAYISGKKYIQDQYQAHLDFLDSLPLFYETDTHIMVHAGINPAYDNWKSQPAHEFIWIREPFYQYKTGLNKVVVFGHTPAMNLHESANIWFGGDKIGIDGACAYGHQLNCLEITSDGEYKTHCVAKGDTMKGLEE